MRRVAVVGTSGSGKTSLARGLARRLGVEHVELDALVHGPGWTEATADELRAKLAPVLEREGWVIDGNYERKLGDLVLEHADTAVWLDLPLPTKLVRLLRRTVRRLRGREALWNDNRETIRGAFVGRESLFAWTLRSHAHQRRTFPSRFAAPHLRHLRLVRLRTEADVERWLAQDLPCI